MMVSHVDIEGDIGASNPSVSTDVSRGFCTFQKSRPFIDGTWPSIFAFPEGKQNK